MKSDSGKYNWLWCSLLHRAEDAKIELSNNPSAEIDLSRCDIEDENGKVIEVDYIPITRSEYESIIKETIDNTAEMMKKILTRNSLRPRDLKFVLMVGGATYTPFVRKRIEELLGIPVNTGIDPTNAIAVGAAYFAATKEIDMSGKADEKASAPGALKIKVAYNRASQEREEMFSAKLDGDCAGLFYRITREDGGYDSGLKTLTPRIVEDLPLQEDAFNVFTFKILDGANNLLATDFDSIQIAQGKYSVAGQMLPEDLSLVKDDLNTRDTKLERIFAKNSVLPARAKRSVDVSKTIIHGSDDEIRIIVVEGPSENHFTVNKTVGYLAISGKGFKRDILRGTEIDLTFELSESRDLTVHAYVNASSQEFSQIFNPTARHVPVKILTEEIRLLETRLEEEKVDAMTSENYEVVQELEKLTASVQELQGEAMLLTLDDVTDGRYKLEDRKRKIAQELNQLTSGKRLEKLRNEYGSLKADVAAIVNQSGNDHERRQLNEVIAREHSFLNSTNPRKLEEPMEQLQGIHFQILRRTPDFLVGWFQNLTSKRELFNDQLQARNLIEAGKRHITAEDYDRLAEVNGRLHNLLPQQEKDSKEMQRFITGIS
jgi:molecular chaperone DnaK